MDYARPLWIRPDSSKTYTGPRRESLNVRYQPCDVPSVPIETPRAKKAPSYAELIERDKPGRPRKKAKQKPRKAFTGILTLQPNRTGRPKGMADVNILKLVEDGPRQLDELYEILCPLLGSTQDAIRQTVCRMARLNRLIKVGHWVCRVTDDPEPLKTRPAPPPMGTVAHKVLFVMDPKKPVYADQLKRQLFLSTCQVKGALTELSRRNCVRQVGKVCSGWVKTV